MREEWKYQLPFEVNGYDVCCVLSLMIFIIAYIERERERDGKKEGIGEDLGSNFCSFSIHFLLMTIECTFLTRDFLIFLLRFPLWWVNTCFDHWEERRRRRGNGRSLVKESRKQQTWNGGAPCTVHDAPLGVSRFILEQKESGCLQ